MIQKALTKPEEVIVESQPEERTCVHHWIIEPPAKAYSKGVCKLCGTEQDFKNDLSFSSWSSYLT